MSYLTMFTHGVHACFVDLSKAFDRLDQEKAARNYDFFIKSPRICSWLYDFSIKRSQQLVWKNKTLEALPIDLGSSQGTVGGPNIFSMSGDKLRKVHESSVLLKYSDDMTPASVCLDRPTEGDKLLFKEEIENVLSWATEYGLEVNKSKSKVLRFSLNSTTNCCCDADFGFPSVTEASLLGVIFQSNCKFSTHVTRLLGHLNRLTFIFRDLVCNGFPLAERSKVFEALAVSKIRYGLSIYGSDAAQLRPINVFLTRCFRKGYVSTLHDIYHLRDIEDRLLHNRIMRNVRHPLHALFGKHACNSNRTAKLYKSTLCRTEGFRATFVSRVLALL